MQKEFYSNGKLLLSGEYAILDGALGLAVPTKFGQSLKLETIENNLLGWQSLDEKNKVWFHGSFDLDHLEVISTSDTATANTLKQLIREARRQNPNFLRDSSGIQVTTHLGFPREWGLGSSSTLINNIAQWAEIDAYELLRNAFGGSGYDIACAQNNVPITYQLIDGNAMVKEVQFDPPFKDSLFFVYLNQKQNSKNAIEAYRKQKFDTRQLASKISSITKEIIVSQDLQDFEALMTEHEIILSHILGIEPVKDRLFPDYPRAIKSLGAWGGDFIMATGKNDATDYFALNGFTTIISYEDMILHSNQWNKKKPQK